MTEQIDRNQIPKPAQPRPFNFPGFEKDRLSNGLNVIVAPKANFPLINILLHIDISPLDDQQGAEGQANLLSYLILEGTKNLTNEQIAQNFERIGAQYNTHLSWTGFFFELNILKQHLEPGFALFSELIRSSVFPQNEFQRIKQETLIDRLQILDMPGRLANEHLLRQLFPDHRYGLPIEGLENTIQNIQPEQIIALYKDRFHNRNATLIFTGNITMQEAFKVTNSFFSDWGKKDTALKTEGSFPNPQKPEVLLLHKPNAAQTEVRIGQFIPPRNHPDFFKIKLMNEIFGGYFLSRLNLNLREKHGFTYSVHSQLIYRPEIGILSVSAAIQNEFVFNALEEIFKETERMRSEGVTAQELENARGYLIGVFPTAFETIDQISDALANIITFNLPDDYYRTFRENLARVSKEEVLEAAQKYLQPENMQVVLVGDRTKIEEKLGQKYRVKIIDPSGKLSE
ncbi:MAG: insulinase family protein [Calditrichaeota bacterium]|nr:insulinase family protein [Calditrichota bacterium]